MAIDIRIETEKRGGIEAIQRKFKDKLSDSVILRSTAQAINSTMARAIQKINKEVKANYNITQKYLKRIADVKPKATSNALYSGIRLQYMTIPIIAFKPKQTSSGIDVAVRKGSPKSIRSAFVQKMPSGHEGVYARGRYQKGQGFVPGDIVNKKGRALITEIKTASPFTMGLSDKVSKQVTTFIGTEVLRATEGILSRRIAELASQ